MIRDFQPDKELLPTDKIKGFIRSEDKYSSIWQALRRYQNQQYVEQQLIKKHGVSKALAKTKAGHITDAIKQAESFFDSSLQSDLLIKPLLQYYGMLNLVKALVLFGKNDLTFDDDSIRGDGLNHHGLITSTEGVESDKKIRDSREDLLNEFAKAKGVPKDKDTVFSLLHQCFSDNKPTSKWRYSIDELASMHPNGYGPYTTFSGNNPKVYPASSTFRTTARGYEHFVLFKGGFPFHNYGGIEPGKGDEFFEEHFPVLKDKYARDENASYGFYSKKPPGSIDDGLLTFKSSTGSSYTIPKPEHSGSLHPIEVEFIMMFILGNLVRYSPQKWHSLVQLSSNDQFYVIEGIINSVHISFPLMILRELSGVEYVYTGDSAYWG